LAYWSGQKTGIRHEKAKTSEMNQSDQRVDLKIPALKITSVGALR
jgi:hypothetical protein